MPERNRALAVFGLNVRKTRKALGLSQQILARKAGLSRTYVSGVECGMRNLTLLNVVRIAKALGISITALFDGMER